jgi:hypothetical protein
MDEHTEVEGVDLRRVWIGVAAQVWRRDPGPVERLAGRALRSPGLARALISTPSLVLPWLIASVVVLLTGAAATLGTGQPVVALAAPGLCASGFAYAYGPGVDPAWELSGSMAVSDRMVLLVRVLAVFAVNAGLALAASLVSTAAAGLAFGWLMPMTAFSALALAVATVSRSANAGVGAGVGCWTIAVLAGDSATGRITAAFDRSVLVVPYLALAVCCALVVVCATRIQRGIA